MRLKAKGEYLSVDEEQRKKDKNNALDQSAKLLLTSSYGKFDQGIHDNQFLISDNDDDIVKFYRKGQVIIDETLANEEQCLIELNKRKISNAKDPSHIGSFILDYSKVLMNRCIDAFDGFEDWNKAQYYQDTDSVIIHNNQLIELQQKSPDIIGKNMGNYTTISQKWMKEKSLEQYFLLPSHTFSKSLVI